MTVRDNFRFYGRGARGNRELTEGEIARLYERRRGWDVDRDALLVAEIERAPIGLGTGDAFTHVFLRPVVPDDAMLERALDVRATHDVPTLLNELAGQARDALPHIPSEVFSPDLRAILHQRWERRGASGWQATVLVASPFVPEAERVVRFELDHDGYMHLFCGRTVFAERGNRLLLETVIAGNLAVLLRFAGLFYAAAGYHGALDAGIAVRGIADTIGHWRLYQMRLLSTGWAGYTAGEYRRTERLVTGELKDCWREVTWRLVRRLVEASSGRGFELFLWPERATDDFVQA